MHLKTDVLACPESTSDSTQHQTNLFFGETQTGGDLFAVLVQPLSRDVQLDPRRPRVGNREGGLESEEGLVLHTDFVGSLDLDRTDDRLVAGDDALMAVHVAIGMDWRGTAVDAPFRVGDRFQDLVGHLDRGHGPSAGFGMIGGHGGHRLSEIPDGVTRSCEDRLVLHDQAVIRHSGNIIRGDDAFDPGDLPGRRSVDRHQSRVGMRTAQGRTPQHVLGPHVTGERESALNLGGAVGTMRIRAKRSEARGGANVGAHASTPRCWPRR